MRFQRRYTSHSSFSFIQDGTFQTKDFKVFLHQKGENGKKSFDETVVSIWHDVPLKSHSFFGENFYNFVCEIPRTETFKIEMDKTDTWNPIKHDIKNDTIRVIKYRPYLWNYGFFPQTWEDSTEAHTLTKRKGDGDPLDVIDIGTDTHNIGQIVPVKVIGSLALLDEDETDWKIIAINIKDDKSRMIKGIDDLEKYKPGITFTIIDFFKNYKIKDGKPQNTIAFNEKLQNKLTTIDVINKSFESWKKLMEGKIQNHNYSLKKKY